MSITKKIDKLKKQKPFEFTVLFYQYNYFEFPEWKVDYTYRNNDLHSLPFESP